MSSPTQPFCLGIDIGYGNLKFAHGGNQEPIECVLPSGATPSELLPKRSDGSIDLRDGAEVLVAGQPWVGGVEPMDIQRYVPELNEDYPRSERYRALFYTALSKCRVDRIDCLVTGLPVRYHLHNGNRQALEKSLSGAQYVTPDRVITVDRVKVLPQPVGAFIAWSAARAGSSKDWKVLVVDVGHYSCDWVVMSGSSIRDLSSDSTRDAMATILEGAAALISQQFGATVSAEKLARALRAREPSVPVKGQAVDIAPFVRAAGQRVAQSGVKAIKNKLDKESDSLDVVLVTGGGAEPYVDALKAALPGVPVMSAGPSITANARGFWLMAHHYMGRK